MDKINKYKYRPFPLGMNGTFYELLENGKTRFFEVFADKYDIDEIEYLRSIDSIEHSSTYEYLENIPSELICDSTNFLYKLCTYHANPTILDVWDFCESVYDYEQHFFADFDKLREYCIDNWNIDVMSFVPRSSTNIP